MVGAEVALTFTCEPDASLLTAIARHEPANPFLTPEYRAFRISNGDTGWVAYVDPPEPGPGTSGLFLFERSGRRERSIEVPTLASDLDDGFWWALEKFVQRRRATRWAIETFAVRDLALPAFQGDVDRNPRMELILDLQDWDPVGSLSSNHRRNARKGEKAGLTMRQPDSGTGIADHAALIGSSLSRRRKRGEDVPDSTAGDMAAGLIDSGVGELYQAVADGDVLSSILVLRSRTGAYYHSAGTSKGGRSCGASHWLIQSVAEQLRERGVDLFFLGGATPDQEGLIRFKSSFGAARIDLERAEVRFPDPITRKALRYARHVLGEAKADWTASELGDR